MEGTGRRTSRLILGAPTIDLRQVTAAKAREYATTSPAELVRKNRSRTEVPLASVAGPGVLQHRRGPLNRPLTGKRH